MYVNARALPSKQLLHWNKNRNRDHGNKDSRCLFSGMSPDGWWPLRNSKLKECEGQMKLWLWPSFLVSGLGVLGLFFPPYSLMSACSHCPLKINGGLTLQCGPCVLFQFQLSPPVYPYWNWSKFSIPRMQHTLFSLGSFHKSSCWKHFPPRYRLKQYVITVSTHQK